MRIHETVYVRGEVIECLPSGRVKVMLMADGTDGMRPFYTNANKVVQPTDQSAFVSRHMGRPVTIYEFESNLEERDLRTFIKIANEKGYDVISLTQCGGLYSVLYRRKPRG